jgi:hypothetical protein
MKQISKNEPPGADRVTPRQGQADLPSYLAYNVRQGVEVRQEEVRPVGPASGPQGAPLAGPPACRGAPASEGPRLYITQTDYPRAEGPRLYITQTDY